MAEKKKKQTRFGKFISEGGVAGWVNRNRKKLKAASKEDLTLFKKSDSKKTTKTKSKRIIKGTPGSSKGAEAAKAMARARIKAGKSTLGEFTGPDRGKKAAQAAAKKSIAAKKEAEKKQKKPSKYAARGTFRGV
ncbi:hypothetical protein CYIG_00054 [Cyanophage NATL1A-7]|uniref:Predicted protein n=1 Tax=Cyanophage NATL1A-7 TaxID=445693 RepID=E3SNC3_9CAUD|nr:hypothetical protein CYIG_00054 [Cyanophage NATL1A-7]ADP00127.1 predicted protein [Cyanophage NATL1A-7]|tara:strand:+ start:81 stop:482 length:402 start_codon:yes stop_codon:yes gene_type:complete